MCNCHRQVRIEIPVEIHEEMRTVGRQKRMTLADIVVAAVREWFSSTDTTKAPGTEVQDANL